MLRIATEADVPAILEIYAPYVRSTTVSFEYDVPTEAEFLQRFRMITAQFPWLVWEENGRVLGYAYGSRPYERAAYSWCAEPSIYLSPEAHGRGIGRKLYAVLEEILKRQGYHVLYALITEENEASLHFHEKLGYNFSVKFPDCGWKLGRWLGVIWMEKRLKTGEIPSSMPVSWLSIVENTENFTNILDILSLP